MLPCQRALFDIPRDVAYLNAASYSPLPLAVQEAGRRGVARKGRPWLVDQAFAWAQHERARAAAAHLIDAQPTEVALVSSIAYGAASAGKALALARGARVLVLEDDHSSPVLEWMARQEAGGFTVETVARPADGDWTAAVLSAIAHRAAAPVALASLSAVHWADGISIDLSAIKAALEAHGAALFVDATQSVGVLPLSVRALDPDFVAFPTYKWLLGPYGRAFLYVAKRHHDKVPLEQTSHGRRAVRAEQVRYFTDMRYVADARRFDMGERDHFITLEMAAIGMEMMATWGSAAVAECIGALSARLVTGLEGLDVALADGRVRAPHIVSLTFRAGMPERLLHELAADQIYVAPRLGRLRISPHVYNDEEDIERCARALRRRLPRASGRTAACAASRA